MRLWLRCETLIRVDWGVWCLLELRLFYLMFKGPKNMSFQESVWNAAVLERWDKTVAGLLAV